MCLNKKTSIAGFAVHGRMMFSDKASPGDTDQFSYILSGLDEADNPQLQAGSQPQDLDPCSSCISMWVWESIRPPWTECFIFHLLQRPVDFPSPWMLNS